MSREDKKKERLNDYLLKVGKLYEERFQLKLKFSKIKTEALLDGDKDKKVERERQLNELDSQMSTLSKQIRDVINVHHKDESKIKEEL